MIINLNETDKTPTVAEFILFWNMIQIKHVEKGDKLWVISTSIMMFSYNSNTIHA